MHSGYDVAIVKKKVKWFKTASRCGKCLSVSTLNIGDIDRKVMN